MGRSPCCSKEGLRKGAWSSMEDEILTNYVRTHGEGKWHLLSIKAGLNRCGKSCRLRWRNYLRPDIKRGAISEDEEDLIIRLHNLLGNRWSLIAGRLPGRTDNEIKNFWNTKFTNRTRCDKKSPSNLGKMIPKSPKRKTTKINLKSKDYAQPILSKAIKCDVATKMLEFEEEHKPLDFLIDLSVGDNDIFFNQDQIYLPNPNSDYRSLVSNEDGALNTDHAHHDHLRDESMPTSLNPSADVTGVDRGVGGSFEWGYKMMSCEKHGEFDLMLELKRVASLLDLDDE